ncbi:hypothetical protein GC194_06675 [bacterium]|nr:hypothetical protein [bacterium]
MKHLIFSIIFCTILGLGSFAQNNDSLLRRPGQVSFISPMGTNGLESGRVINNFSFNILAGYHAGLDGIEIGGLLNVLKHDMQGLQIAGFGNTVLGAANGVQIAGFYNTSGGFTKGAQIAGFSNVVTDSVNGFQAAGFSNVVNGAYTGSQLAGFSNVVHGNFNGFQASGFSNVTTGRVHAAQIAGFCNVASQTVVGPQISGFANVASDSMKGAQVAGFANVVTGNLEGFQASGFINVAKNLKGVQLGFINISDSISDGFALGFLNISKSGYHKFELSANETFYGNLSFKTGTENLYNIFTVGARPYDNSFIWSYGYGLGTQQKLGNKLKMNIDLVSSQVMEGTWRIEDLHLLNKLNVCFTLPLAGSFEVFAGPDFNLLVSGYRNDNNEVTGGHVAPYSISDYFVGNKVLRSYVGLTAGIRVL